MAKTKQTEAVDVEEQAPDNPENGRPVGIVAKVFEFQSRVATFTKDAKNAHFRYQFASATAINEAVKPILKDLGLVAQIQTSVEDVSPANLVTSKSVLVLLDADGDFKNGIEEGVNALTFSSIGSGIDSGDKAAMKAATASQKYVTIAAAYGATADDPEADSKTDVRSTQASAPAQKAPSVRSNGAPPQIPAGTAAAAQGPVDMGDGVKVVTVDVDKVYDGRAGASGKTGPGTVVSMSGHKFDTFDKGLLGVARDAKSRGKKVNIMYTYNEQFKRNSIVEHGLSVFGEVAEAPAPAPAPAEEEGDAY